MSEMIRQSFREKVRLHDQSTTFFLDQLNQCEREDRGSYKNCLLLNHKYFLGIFTQLLDSYIQGFEHLEYELDKDLYDEMGSRVENIRMILAVKGIDFE